MNRMLAEAIDSIGIKIVGSPRDWSLDHRDAWVYGICIGWDDEALKEVRVLHKWDDVMVQRLSGLREAFQKAAQ